MTKRDNRSLSVEAQEELRKRAVQYVLSGKKQKEAAKVFQVTDKVVSRWMVVYRKKGFGGLKGKKKGRPKGGVLKPWQAAQVVRTIQGRCPDQLRLPFYLWTREAVGQLIEQRFGVRRSVWQVGRYLSQWGFTPQKPIRKAFERDPVAVKRWLEEEYPRIRVQAKIDKALIFWGDEMGLRSDHAAGRSYGRKGITPVIPGTGQRFRCNMLSAITNQGKLCFMIFRKKFEADVFLSFLKRLVRHTKRKVYLIVDRHPVHRSSKVVHWLEKEENIMRIRLFYLPGYSPELNPDEMLNQDVKSNALGRQRPRNQHEMMGNVRHYLWKRQKQPSVVRNYFQGKHVRYASLEYQLVLCSE